MSAKSRITSDRLRIGSGTFAATMAQSPTGPPGVPVPASASLLSLTAPWGGYVTLDGYVKGTAAYDIRVRACPIASGTVYEDLDGYAIVPGSANWSDVTASYELWADCDIVYERDVTTHRDTHGWSTLAGSAVPDLPYDAQLTVKRLLKPGGTAYATITATDGTVTVTASGTAVIAARTSPGYTVTVGGSVQANDATGIAEADWTLQHGDGATWHDFLWDDWTYDDTDGGGVISSGPRTLHLTAGATDPPPDSSNAISTLTSEPDQSIACYLELRRMGEAMAGTWPVHRAVAAGGVIGTVATSGAVDDTIRQTGGHSVTATLDGVSQPGSSATSERGPSYWYLPGTALTANGDDTDEWRILLHGLAYDALTIGQSVTHTLDDCTALTVTTGHYQGTWTADAASTVTVTGGRLTFTPGPSGGTLYRGFADPAGVSGYRYLSLYAQGTVAGATGQPIASMSIGAKRWDNDPTGAAFTATIGTASAQQTDLCGPSNLATTVDALDTRWRADMPTDDDHVDGDGAMWGVQRVRGSVAWSFPASGAGLTYTLNGLKMTHSPWTQESRLSLQSSFNRWVLFSDYDVGSTNTKHYLQTHILGNTDGRLSMEESILSKVVVTPASGSATTTYVESDIAAVKAKIEGTVESWPITGIGTVEERSLRNCGWSAAYAGACDSADGADWSDADPNDLNRNRPGVWLGGQGGVFAVWTAGSPPTWRWYTDVDMLPTTYRTVKAQQLFDVINWEPGLGDALNLRKTDTGQRSGELAIAAHRVLRGRAWGLTLDNDALREQGVPVVLTETAGSAVAGSDTSGTVGLYLTEARYGHGALLHTVTATIGTATPSSQGTVYSRWPMRRCFAGSVPAGNWISYDVTPAGRHARAYVDAGSVVAEWSGHWDGVTWGSRSTVAEGSVPCCRWEWAARWPRLWVSYAVGGAVAVRYTHDDGVTWGSVMTIGTGSYPAMCMSTDGRQWHYWVASGAIKGLQLNSQGGTVLPEFTAVASGVDDDAIAAEDYASQGGVWRMGLLYRSAGALKRVSSLDGVTFA